MLLTGPDDMLLPIPPGKGRSEAMNTEELEKVQKYLEIYADAFNGMVRNALLARGDGNEPHAGGPIAYDPDKLLSLVGGHNKVDMDKLMGKQLNLMQQHMDLWQHANRAMLGLEDKTPDLVEEDKGDRRFSDPEWQSNPVYSYIKQAYLLNSRMLSNIVDSIEFDDEKEARRARFYARQYINSTSPTNMVLTNPEVCREILATRGENLVHGINNFVKDLQQSPVEALKITQSDPDAFELGGNLAVTPGKVVFQNELLQLIQYTPATDKVYERPILFFPPFINKYYILDLDQKKSMTRWLVEQGFTVFMVSWVNPDAALAETTFDDYVVKGAVEAVKAALAISGAEDLHAVGYCVGGTLLAIAQAYLQAKDENSIKSCTFFTTLTEFSEPGELGAYVSEDMLPILEQNSRIKGIFDGRILALSFNLLRENNLFWSYFINNYLKGKDPVAFDILYWNSDSTNIPAETFSWYLRNLYQANKLQEPGAIEIDDTAIDLSRITTPSYVLATQADHIVPWQAAYASSRLYGGDVRFVLGASGHVAGVVNPPDPGKYPHFVSEYQGEDAEAWKAEAQEVAGSWWTDWQGWLLQQGDKQVKARQPGNKNFPPLEDAPGSYVKVRI